MKKESKFKIFSQHELVKNSVSFDMEWIPFTGPYWHNKTRILAASFCTNTGERIVLHINSYRDNERALVIDIVNVLSQFNLVFVWDGGRYPYNYLEMIDHIFGSEKNTIEVCSGSIKGRVMTPSKVTPSEENESSISSILRLSPSPSSCFTVDINPDMKPDCVADGQNLDVIPSGTFNRWRCDPPYNVKTAKEIYGTELPIPSRLLKAGARVCKPGSLMFLLLGPQNYQIHPKGVKRIGYIDISVVPNNEIRCLNIYYKFADV